MTGRPSGSMSALLDRLRPGMTIFLHAGPGESIGLRHALQENPAAAAGVTFRGVFIPGLNDFDYATLTDSTFVESVFVTPSNHASFAAGRHRFLPLHYSELPAFAAERPADLAILHAAPAPDGRYGCGLNADVIAQACRAAGQVAVIENAGLPAVDGPVATDRAALIVRDDTPPAVYRQAPADDAASLAIAAGIAGLVDHGDTVQIGIGRLPSAILAALRDHRNLRIHSGMITDDVADLDAAGALSDGGRPVTTGMALGGEKAWRYLAGPRVRVVAAEVTHHVPTIAAIDRFTAINAAIEVDLFGQMNGECVGGRQISSVGGINDFVRGARLSHGGRSIVALPAQAKGASRIVPRLSGPFVSVGRADADIVVTEHGCARLRFADIDSRAAALIAIAAPEHRPALTEAWQALRRTI